ncbi:SDR family oxidoreductase [Clostridium sp. 19966]|uniref:SDR family NAD(P)-dependent oxidoreductase n=1 Tax=Clostridium sp. 19966 TaxID=2768166 RepID=UPI0028DEFC11|nr:SDR family oxidoreductase [Clostridium sp. 19966]MDT8718407.1 SDR family oxidoreductase [Clostridium sp. 19966]
MSSTLITGASSGIGLELAKVFAAKGHDLVLVARSKDKLELLSKELENKHSIKAHIVDEDLSKQGAAKRVYDRIKKLGAAVEILVNNAGLGAVGEFCEIPEEKDEEIIAVNITALTEITKLFAGDMVRAKSGRILNVASTGSFHPGPYTAVYYASKAYVLSFSEALSIELEPYNIKVTALCPGAVKTNFAKAAGKNDSKGAMQPWKVASEAYEAMMKNKNVAVPGMLNKIFVRLPKRLVIRKIGEYQKSLALKH